MNKKASRETSRNLDQFYTNPVYAKHFLDIVGQFVDRSSFDLELEPSAGTGSFYNLLDPNKRVGLDLDPKATGIIQTDFFDWEWPRDKNIITVGNPPFGKNANLAVKFFNHAANFSDVIAFIVPRTFRKASITNRLNLKFHCIYDEIVPDQSFIFNDKPYNVWCCSQIWIRKDTRREKIKILNLSDFRNWFSVVDKAQADISIQRVGGRAGTVRTENFQEYSSQSHYFIKASDKRVLQAFHQINFDTVKYNTAGNPSISPSELVELWTIEAKKIGLKI